MTDLPFDLFRQVTDYSPTTAQRVVAIVGMLMPFDCPQFKKKRVGRTFDGGYVMVDDFEDVVAAYSLGISDDVSWDTDIANLGIDVFQYDHTIDALPESHPRFKWAKIGVSDVDGADRRLQTLERLLSSNGHDDATDLILKCDVEGYEWKIFSGSEPSILKRFRQIVVEVHGLQELTCSKHAETIRKTITNLTANHHVVHIHANNWAPWAILGSIPIPSVIELTLLRKDRGLCIPSSERFPTALDMPNNPDRADFPIGDILTLGRR